MSGFIVVGVIDLAATSVEDGPKLLYTSSIQKGCFIWPNIRKMENKFVIICCRSLKIY